MLNSINDKPIFRNEFPITTKNDKKGYGINLSDVSQKSQS